MTQDQRTSSGSYKWRLWRALGVAALCGLAFVGACGLAVSDSGSNSNWLSRCSTDESCSDGLSCLCGVCTVQCTTESGCGSKVGATCRTFGTECVNSVGHDMSMCLAECTKDEDCTNLPGISDDLVLECSGGLCRERAEDQISIGGGGNDTGMGGMYTPIILPPGDWVSRGEPASCGGYEFPAVSEGTGPWGSLHTSTAWVTYTTGSSNPEFMFVTMRGTWEQGDLRIGVSISIDLKSGTDVASGDGIEIWMSRYLAGYVNQEEVQGVLQVTTYNPPVPLQDGQPLDLQATLLIDDGDWAMSVPIDITATCNYSTVIK